MAWLIACTTPNDISVIGAGVHKVYDEGFGTGRNGRCGYLHRDGRFMMVRMYCLVTKGIHEKHIYKEYIGVDACGKPYETGYLRLIPIISQCSARGGCTL